MMYRCSGYTAKGTQCANETENLWRGVVALCSSHRIKHGREVQDIKKKAVEKYVEGIREDRAKRESERLVNESRVYFVRAGNVVKIGFSVNPRERLSQIRSGSGGKTPVGLDASKAEIVATVAGGRDVERDMHRRFHHLRVSGEWFHATPELAGYIQAVTS